MADPGHLLWRRWSKQDLLQQIFVDSDGFGQASNVTQMFVKGVIDDESRSVRVSTIVLGSFNVLATFAMATIILHDSYQASKRHGYTTKWDENQRGLEMLRLKGRKFFTTAIHPAETFPLILALCSFGQGVIFIGAQATGLSSLFVDGCTTTTRLVFLAIFIVPYVQVIFGLECAIRGLKKRAFPPRRKFDVLILLLVVLLMLISTSIPTWIWPRSESCFASLAWFVWRYGVECLIIVVVSLAMAAISACAILYRLKTVAAIDQQERIAASRMVYYQIHAMISLVLLMPWFISLVMRKPTLDTAMTATATLNLHGILSAALQIFLRSNTAAMAIMPRGMAGWGRRGQLRIWGPNELGFDAHLLEPVSGPRSPGSARSRASSTVNEKQRPRSVGSPRTPETTMSSEEMEQKAMPWRPENSEGNLPTTTDPSAALPEKLLGHQRKQSYTLFPQEVTSPSAKNKIDSPSELLNKPASILREPTVKVSDLPTSQKRLHETVYAADDLLLLPPPLRVMGVSNHRRDSSMASSATVQIGLRLSNVADDLPETSSLKNQSLELPSRLQTTNLIIPAKPSFHPSPLQRSATTGSPMSPAVRAARMKTLPPIPRGSTASALAEVHSKPKLSPTVYNPQSAKEMPRSPLREQLLSPIVPREGSPTRQAGENNASWI